MGKRVEGDGKHGIGRGLSIEIWARSGSLTFALTQIWK